MIYLQYVHSPFGELVLGEFSGQLCLCDWKYRKMRDQIDHRIQTGLQAEFKLEETDFLDEVKSQLNEYFARERTSFDLPLHFVGSDFQKSVWEKLITIPYGKTTSYMELSRALGDEKAIRAVATANGANAISIIVPCHRVIGSDGSLTGYAGGLWRKKWLLEHESSSKQLSLL